MALQIVQFSSSEKELKEKSGDVDQNQPIPAALTVKTYEKSIISQLQLNNIQEQQNQSQFDLVIPKRKTLSSAGTTGRKLLIETNHFRLAISNLNRAVHYNVTVEPNTLKRCLRTVVEEFRKQYYPERCPAFDGVNNLYGSSELPFGREISGAVDIIEDEQTQTYKVTIKFMGLVDLSALSKYFQEGSRQMVTHEAIHCLDVIFRSAPASRFIPVGRSFFTKPCNLIIDLGQGLEMYYGFHQSVTLGWKPFLNVDVAHKAFSKALNIIDLIKELCECSVDVELNKRDYNTIDKYLRNLNVEYEIPNQSGSKKVVYINELDEPASKAIFTASDGSKMTVEYYFANMKSYQLKYPHMPCLWIGSKMNETKRLLPVELCTIVSNQVTNRTLSPDQTSKMIRASATSTIIRKTKILTAVQDSQFNSDPTVQEFDISISNEFEKVDARILKAPALEYAKNKVTPSKGVWRADKLINGKVLNKWCILCIDSNISSSKIEAFANMMINQGKSLGMKISTPTFSMIRWQHGTAMKSSLEKQFLKVKHMELVVVIIPNDSTTYTYVKQAAELYAGILTQCVRANSIYRLNTIIVDNILLKVNTKLNGINYHYVQRPPILDRPCIIMGADVTHPNSTNRHSRPSVAAVTSSYDGQALHYSMSWQLQKAGQEIISDLGNIVQNHLLHFYKKNNHTKPERIIFFRDGISDSQFQTVLNVEVQAIRQACLQLQKDGMYKPKITFLIVQKRHHTRFFPASEKDSKDSKDKNFNVPVGTVVDTEITHPTALDFYLVSHASRKGVARPTKYSVLYDDNDMNEDELEQLSYHLCYIFSRCSRSVSYPAPTYYAHLAAARARVYCEQQEINMENLQREQERILATSETIRDMPMFYI